MSLKRRPEIRPPFSLNKSGISLHVWKCVDVKGRIHKINVLRIHFLLSQPQTFAKALEMHDFAGSQELDYIINIRVITEPENVIIGDSRFLLRRQIFRQIGNQITLYLHRCSAPWEAGCGNGVDTCGMIHKICVKTAGLQLLLGEIFG